MIVFPARSLGNTAQAKSLIVTPFDIDAYPSEPSTDNDEFDGTSVSANWNTSKLLGSTTSIVSGNLQLVSGVPGGDSNRVRFLYKSIDRNDVAYIIKVQSLDTGSTNGSSGFVLWDSVGGKYEIFQAQFVSANTVLVQGYTAAGGFGTNFANPTTVSGLSYIYLKIVLRGTLQMYYYSFDGKNWILANLHSATAYLANAADKIGVGTSTFSGSNTTGRFFYFRKYPFTTAP